MTFFSFVITFTLLSIKRIILLNFYLESLTRFVSVQINILPPVLFLLLVGQDSFTLYLTHANPSPSYHRHREPLSLGIDQVFKEGSPKNHSD